EGQVVVHDWGRECLKTDGFLKARLTVVGRNGGRDSITKTVDILGFNPVKSNPGLVDSSFTSEMLQAKGAAGRVVLSGGRGFPVSADAPARIQVAARERVGVEAVATAATAPFLWRFDFSGAKGFVPGSLLTLSGQEVARDAYSVVLRFDGTAFERARFEYRVAP
ncbi:MAG TPA: hypothetical protein VIE88_17235, partial [Vicinamibacteria bacterium]